MSRRSLLANFRATTLARIGSAGMSFLLFWWLARQIPAVQVGAFVLAMSVFFTLQALPLLGLNFALVRSAATEPEKLGESVNNFWWFSVPVSIVLALALAGYAFVATSDPVRLALFVTSLAMLPTSWTVVAEGVLVGIERMDWIARANVLEAAWRLAGSCGAVLLGGELLSIMLVFLVGRVGVAALYLLIGVIPRPMLGALPGKPAWAALLKLTPVFFSIAVLAAVNARYDMLSIGGYVSLREVAEYSAAAKLYEALLMVPTLGAFVALPRLSQMFRNDASNFGASLSALIRGVSIAMVPLALVGAIGAPWFMQLVFPAGFSAAAPAMQLLVFAVVLATIDVILSSTMMASNSQSSDLKCMAVGLVTVVAAVAVFVPLIGITGSALAIVCNMLARVVYRVAWAASRFGIRDIWFVLVRVMFCGAVAWGAAYYSPGLHWSVNAVVAVASYAVLAVATGLLRLAELRVLPRTIQQALNRTP